ncbi:phosphodiester glycosidase family protein [Peribacillus simplex]|uniref:phosphodiester glycosidase family protein n=1 Tax=Peribacillus simplex TaxID=1478 RepID=UPI00339A0974
MSVKLVKTHDPTKNAKFLAELDFNAKTTEQYLNQLQKELNSHAKSKQAHNARDILYESDSVYERLNSTIKRINNLILNASGDSNAEVVDMRLDARGKLYDTVGERANEEQLKWEETLPITLDKDDKYTVSVEHFFSEVEPLEYWITTITPKDSEALKSLVRKGIAHADEGFNTLSKQTIDEMTDYYRGAIAINASGWNSTTDLKMRGVHIKDGEILQNESHPTQYTLGIDKNGIMNVYEGTMTAQQLLAKGVVNTWFFSIPIVLDGAEVNDSIRSRVSSYNDLNPRQVIGQRYNSNEILILTVDGRSSRSAGATLTRCAQILINKNCRVAYNLDGGGSTQTVIDGEVINTPSDGKLRPVPDILYIEGNRNYQSYLPVQQAVEDAKGGSRTLKDRIARLDRQSKELTNDLRIELKTSDILWSGVMFMNGSQTAKPTKKLSDCNNGWLLIWSDYNAGTGAGNYDYVISPIPKKLAELHSGGHTLFSVPRNITDTSDITIVKLLSVYNDRLVGDDRNSLSVAPNRRDVVLRYIISF